MKRAFACLITAGIALAGCGGSSASAPIARANAASLRADLASVRATVAAHQPAAAHAATARMRADIERLASTGGLSAADGRLMLTALAQADSRISAGVHPAAPRTVTVAPAVPSGPAAGPPAHGHGPDHGHGPKPKGADGGD